MPAAACGASRTPLSFVYNLRFPGQVYDNVAGLSSNYFRDYDAATGSYAESDPIGLDGGMMDPMSAGHALHFGAHMICEGRPGTIRRVGEAGRLAVPRSKPLPSAVSGQSLQQGLLALISLP